MAKDCVVPYDIARPIWSSMSNALRYLKGFRFEFRDRLETLMTGEYPTHFAILDLCLSKFMASFAEIKMITKRLTEESVALRADRG